MGCVGSNGNTSNSENFESFEHPIIVETKSSINELKFRAEVISNITANDFGRVHVGLTNKGELTWAIDYFSGSTAIPFHGEIMQNTSGGSIWVRRGGSPEEKNNCWFASGFIDDIVQVPELGPGEVIEGELGIFTNKTEHRTNNSNHCVKTGSFKGLQDFDVFKDGYPGHSSNVNPDDSLTLEFTISIED